MSKKKKKSKTVLYADDFVADFVLPTDDEQALRVVRTHHPEHPDSDMSEFLKYHRYCNDVELTLRDANFEVTPVSHYDDAIDKAQKHFDIAIVDLRWSFDDKFRGRDARNAGWDICKAIDENNERLRRKPTLQIAISSRFNDEKEGPGLLSTAATHGRLPFVRIVGSRVNLEFLKACTQFLAETLDDPSDLERMRNDYLEEPLRQLKTWSRFALAAACLGFVLVLSMAFGAVHKTVELRVLTAVNGVISTAVALLFYRRLGIIDQTAKDTVEALRRDIESNQRPASLNDGPKT